MLEQKDYKELRDKLVIEIKNMQKAIEVNQIILNAITCKIKS